jgi:hypothetical protein
MMIIVFSLNHVIFSFVIQIPDFKEVFHSLDRTKSIFSFVNQNDYITMFFFNSLNNTPIYAIFSQRFIQYFKHVSGFNDLRCIMHPRARDTISKAFDQLLREYVNFISLTSDHGFFNSYHLFHAEITLLPDFTICLTIVDKFDIEDKKKKYHQMNDIIRLYLVLSGIRTFNFYDESEPVCAFDRLPEPQEILTMNWSTIQANVEDGEELQNILKKAFRNGTKFQVLATFCFGQEK